MWNKIYLALLAAGILVVAFFAYYGWSWLQSIGEPRAAWEAFNYHKRAGAYFVVGWTVMLLIVGNIILWKRKSAWALGITEVYFVGGALVFLVWLHISGIRFCLDNAICVDPSRAVGPLLTALGGLGLSVFVIANNFIVVRLREKLHDKRDEDEKENSRSETES